MSPLRWLAFAAAAAAATAFAFWLYRRREPVVVRGRTAGASLRAASLVLVLLLLFDPHLARLGAGAPERAAVLDDSYSMLLPAAPGATDTRWRRALAALERDGAPATLTTSGARWRAGAEPTGAESRLAAALGAAAEAGVDQVTVYTDGAVEDAAAARAAATRAGLRVDVVAVADSPVANAALAAATAPAWATAGDTIEVRAEVAALDVAGDDVVVTLTHAGETLDRASVAPPGPGRRATARFRVATPRDSAGATVRYDLALSGVQGDAWPADDARPVYVRLGERPAGVVMLSFRPDWEARFLLPVLESALGLPARGYLKSGAGWLAVGGGVGPVTETAVRRAARDASIVVLQGMDAAPGWASALASGPRVLTLETGSAAERGGNTLPGEWYPLGDLPASPLVPLLASADWSAVPPLQAVTDERVPSAAWVALQGARDRRGRPQPLVIGWRDGEARRVRATGSGYYRWPLAGPGPRRAHQALWSAVAAWLAEGMGALEGEPVRPAERVVDRGEPVRWILAPGLDSARVSMRRIGDAAAADDVALDTALVAGADSLRTRALPPGRYAYEARPIGGATIAGAVVRGEVTVAGWSPEFVRPARPLEFDATDADAGASVERRGLHTYVWPWLLLVALLCSEWVLRRRLGLR